ncbi:ImmA/IrrE family metallo-endopeptidase [Pueribacillus sp. YX66]|uniref:ImmA/IrrE family metallo-endopeptidase n=1 Tax=Pueribacillus sp. YX66 TaxID=3229242 RepID=UPI00358CE485
MPKQKAVKLIEKYKTNDPFELASYKKIQIITWNLHIEIKGFYKYLRRNKFIVLNSSLNEHLKRFVCSHELGHAILHPRENTPFMRENTFFSIDRIEVEANTFAVELLLPDNRLEEYKNTRLSLEEIAGIHGIPKEVARLKKCNLF